MISTDDSLDEGLVGGISSFPGNPQDGHPLMGTGTGGDLTDPRSDLAVVDRSYQGCSETSVLIGGPDVA